MPSESRSRPAPAAMMEDQSTGEPARRPLQDYPVVVEVPVAWGEMDALGHVNNVVYYRYCETARVAYFVHLGLASPTADPKRGLILASSSCRYKAPVTYPDTLSVGARVAGLGEDRMRMEYAVFSRRLGKIAVLGEAEVVSYDYERRCRTPFDPSYRAKIVALEGREPPTLGHRTVTPEA
jgi:acyl-CoA thioester hydrolase